MPQLLPNTIFGLNPLSTRQAVLASNQTSEGPLSHILARSRCSTDSSSRGGALLELRLVAGFTLGLRTLGYGRGF